MHREEKQKDFGRFLQTIPFSHIGYSQFLIDELKR